MPRRAVRRIVTAGLAVALMALTGCGEVRTRLFPAPPPPLPPSPPEPVAPLPPKAPRVEPPPRPPVEGEPVPPPVLTPEGGSGGAPRPPSPPPPRKPAPPASHSPAPPRAAPTLPPAPEPTPSVLAPRVGREDEERLRQESEGRILRAEHRLDGIDPQRLNPDGREALATVRRFLAMAKDALAAQDLLRASTLSEKAQVLAEDLLGKAR